MDTKIRENEKMPLNQRSDTELKSLAPSPFLLKFAQAIVQQAHDEPILDVACGGGRNAVLLAYLGARVIGVDRDLELTRQGLNRLRGTLFGECLGSITIEECDLIRDAWPFGSESMGAVINVHFLHEPLIRQFLDSLKPGGFLLLETVGGHGENFRELPVAGRLRGLISENLNLLEYRERPCGPPELRRVAVKLLGTKKIRDIGGKTQYQST